MKQAIIGFTVGAVSGLCTYEASVYALAYTNAFVKPREFSILVWQPLVVFGPGAFAVALVIHLFALCFSSSKASPPLVGFLAALATVLAVSGTLALAYKTLLAWSLGAISASALRMWFRSNSSPKWTRKKPRVA